MRKLKRSIARANMLKKGWDKLNKEDKDGRSKFAKHWRKFV